MYYNRVIGSLIFKISFISIWMSAIPEVLSCWGPSSTKLGVTTPDPKLLVGTQLAIDCTIFNTTIEYNKKVYDVNSSMISFKFDGKYYPEDKIHLINETVAQLSVDEASVEDNGMYYCLLNISGSGLDHNPLVCVSHVTVGYKPQNVKDFKCISLYYRKLHCSWTPQYNPIQTSYHLEDRMHASTSSKFNYLSRSCGNSPTENSCEWRTDTVPPFRNTAQKFYLLLTGENEFGKNEQSFVIEHYSIIKPNIPRELRHSLLDTNNVTISWSAPDYIVYDEDLLKHIIYEIRYFRTDPRNPHNANIKPIIIDGIRQTNITLTHLIPFTQYNVSIRCKTMQSIKDEYWSEFSSIIVTTLSDVPYFAPVLIPESFQTVKNTEGNRSITLFWKPIPIENHNALGFHYSIEYRQTSRRKSRATNNLYHNPVNVKSDNTTHTFIHMDSNTAYTFKIYGVNAKGMSQNFSEITVDKNDNIPHKPTNIDVFSYGGGRYELQWGKPRDNPNSGPIMNYTVFWCQTLRPRPFPCEGNIDWVHNLNRSIALELPDVKTNYQFAVSANALKSSSGMSWAECIVPIDGRLDKLSEVRAVAQNPTSITVIWKLNCPAQKRVVEGYKIAYCKVDKESKHKICNKPKSVTVDNVGESFTLNGLEPYSEYKVTVVALTDSGPSDESDPKYVETPPDSPEGAPFNLKITETNSDSIELNWEKPLIPNGQISHYDILCDDKTYFLDASQCSNSCSFRIPDLLSYHSYKVQVRACNSKSLCSPYTSDAFSVKTLTSAPGQMDPPRTEIINASSVRISWSPPILANGPIDYYLLKHIYRDNKTEPIVYNISGNQKEYYMSLDCNSYKDDSTSYQQYSVSIVAVNKKGNEELVGDYSESSNLNACLVADENEAYIIGIVVGGTLGLMLFVIVLYMLVRWMKRKINTYNSLVIELPPGLGSPQLVTDANYDSEIAERFPQLNRTDSSPNIVSDNILPIITDDDSLKNRHGSGFSHVSTSSTEGLIYRNAPNQPNDALFRMVSSDSGQHGSVSSSYNGEHISSDSGVEIDPLHNPKDNNDLQRVNKVGPTHLPRVDEISSRHSDSSGSKDSGIENSNGISKKRKKRLKSTKNNKISAVLPTTTRNEAINPLYDCPINHTVCIYSLLANSEPSIYDLPIREDDNNLSHLSKFYKPEMAKSLSNIIQNSSPSDSNNGSNGSTRTASPNDHPYYKYGVRRQIHYHVTTDLKNISHDNKTPTKANNGYIAIDSIFNNSEQNACKPLKKARLEHDWSQNSYDAEVSSTSSNGDNEQSDIITQPNLFHRSSGHFSDSEKIQNNSLVEVKANGEHNNINSSVNPLTTSKEMSSNLNAVECMPALNETKSFSTPSKTSPSKISPSKTSPSKTSPIHLLKDSNGYVSHNALTQLSANKVKPNLVKNPNGYVVINDGGIEMKNIFVPNNSIVNHMTQV